jgi:hypothetical protein
LIVVPCPSSLQTLMRPAGLLDEAVNDAQTQLGFPLPESFVVKNGSNTSSSAEGMPVPVSLTAIIT